MSTRSGLESLASVFHSQFALTTFAALVQTTLGICIRVHPRHWWQRRQLQTPPACLRGEPVQERAIRRLVKKRSSLMSSLFTVSNAATVMYVYVQSIFIASLLASSQPASHLSSPPPPFCNCCCCGATSLDLRVCLIHIRKKKREA